MHPDHRCNELLIVTEVADRGDLDRALNAQRAPLAVEPALFVLAQILLGLQYVHDHEVLHRDLKASNVLLFSSGHVKLGDLGVAKVCPESCLPHLHTVVGSPYFMSPEICEAQPYGSKGDVWAFGCIAYQCVTRQRPFEAPTLPALVVRILAGEYAPVPPEYAELLEQIIAPCLVVDQQRRAGVAELLA